MKAGTMWMLLTALSWHLVQWTRSPCYTCTCGYTYTHIPLQICYVEFQVRVFISSCLGCQYANFWPWLMWLSWLESCPINKKFLGVRVYVPEATGWCFSLINVSLPFSLPPFPSLKSISMSSSEDKRKGKNSMQISRLDFYKVIELRCFFK